MVSEATKFRCTLGSVERVTALVLALSSDDQSSAGDSAATTKQTTAVGRERAQARAEVGLYKLNAADHVSHYTLSPSLSTHNWIQQCLRTC
jgi:hypothetical protein